MRHDLPNLFSASQQSCRNLGLAVLYRGHRASLFGRRATERCFVLPLMWRRTLNNFSEDLCDGAASVAAAAVQRQTLDDKRRVFAEDFAGGRIGTRFNTFEHRSRILRQLAAKISEMPRNNEEKRLVSFVSHRRI